MKKPKKNFAKQLSKNLKKSKLGQVRKGILSDKSGQWVSLMVGDNELSFSFCPDGSKLERIGLYSNKVEIVDSTQVWQAFNFKEQ